MSYPVGCIQDTEEPERFIETFVMESWLEFLRTREAHDGRGPRDPRSVRSFPSGSSDPHVSRMIYGPRP